MVPVWHDKPPLPVLDSRGTSPVNHGREEDPRDLRRRSDGRARARSDGRYGFAFGGDTFNTAVYLARAGIPAAYATAMGDDPYSDGLMALAAAEGVNGDLIARVPGPHAGLYLIETDAKGERKFYYWRDTSPARELFELENWAAVCEALLAAGWSISPASRCRSIPTPGSAASSPRSSSRASRAWSWRSTAISVRAAGRATSRAPARCSPRR
jgi:sugar/nucleoside kinase (ribokinase family)